MNLLSSEHSHWIQITVYDILAAFCHIGCSRVSPDRKSRRTSCPLFNEQSCTVYGFLKPLG
jgi:hypothetical protein